MHKQIAKGKLCIEQGAQPAALRQARAVGSGGRWKGGSRHKKEGTCGYLWPSHVDIWQKPTQHRKAIIIQLKIKFFKNAQRG